MREGKSAVLIKTYELPAGVGTQPFAKMAAAHGLRVVPELSETAITLEGSEDDQAAFADRLEQLRRLWRAQRGTLTEVPARTGVGRNRKGRVSAGRTGARPTRLAAALRAAFVRFLSTP
jgi:hypothetical protein